MSEPPVEPFIEFYEEYTSQFGKPPGSLNELQRTFYLGVLTGKITLGGGDVGGISSGELDSLVALLVNDDATPSALRSALDALYGSPGEEEGVLNDAGVASLINDNSGPSATRGALNTLLAGKADSPAYTSVGTISSTGNTNVTNAGSVRVVTATVSSSLSGTHTLTLQGGAGTAQGRIVLLSLTVQAGAGTLEIRNLTSDGTLLGSVEGGDNDRTYVFITAFQTTNYLAVKAIEGGISTDENNALELGNDGKPWLDSDLFSDFVTGASLASDFKYVLRGWILEEDEDETDLPEDFPTGPLYEGGPLPLVLRKKPEEA